MHERACLGVDAQAAKFVSMMKLTTPATASAPYTDEAPPVSTSTRLISADGMKLMSGTLPPAVGSPGCRRRPLISTRVRFAPRPRRLTVAVPVAPFDTFEPCAAKACGSELIRSSVRVVP